MVSGRKEPRSRVISALRTSPLRTDKRTPFVMLVQYCQTHGHGNYYSFEEQSFTMVGH